MVDDLHLSQDELPREELLSLHASMVLSFTGELGESNYRPLNVTLKDCAGVLLGGLSAATFWNWLVIDILWVDPRYRKRGFGRRMVSAAEMEAVRRGCRAAHLDTFSPRAARFYERNGYTIVCSIDAPDVGVCRYSLRKTFQDTSPNQYPTEP
jgi:GNAT superfamily N-acetyltransferase